MRNYKRKSQRAAAPGILKHAAEIVLLEDRSIRSVAKDYDVCHVTLYRLVKKLKRK